MRRLLILCTIALLMIGGSALAAGPTNPYFNDAKLPTFMVYTRSSRAIRIKVVADRSQIDVGDDKMVLPYESCDDDGWWKASACYVEMQQQEVVGEDGSISYENVEVEVEGNFEYQFFITADENDLPVTHGFKAYSAEREFTYDFVIPGDFYLWVYVRDDQGASRYARYSLMVTDESAVTEEQKIAELVAECAAAGCESDYDKALWFHDWLIDNARYDSSLSYYSSDSVLLRGTGVCDGYSRAFEKLLNAVGIDCVRFESSEMNHSWNQVKMDGDWYFVDVTWDDPVVSSSTGTVSGYENHIYFGLPEELLEFDHVFEPDARCVSYENNYFIKSGKVSKWTATPATKIQADLDNCYHTFSVTPPQQYQNEHGVLNTVDHGIVYGLTAYALSQQEWTVNDQTLKIDASYDWTNKIMPVKAVLDDENVLRMPSSLAILGEGAFEDCEAYDYVVITDGDVQIGAGAFASDKNIWVPKP